MKHIISLITIAFILFSCSKFLDKKSNSGLSTPERLLSLQALLDNSDIMNISTSPAFGEASADNYFIPDNDYSGLSEQVQGVYTWNPIEYNYSNDWSGGYTTIFYANLCLEGLGKIPRSAANAPQWDYIKGAALFHRAYSFLNLVWTFAKAYDEQTSSSDPGIDLRLQTDYSVPSKRSSVKDSYERVIADATDALGYLPETSTHVFRPNKTAGYGLLARAFLSMRKYDSAFKYSNLCLGLNNNLIDYNTIVNGNNPFANTAYSGETIFYTAMTFAAGGAEILTPAYGIARIDTSLYDSYDTADLRKDLFFTPRSGYFQFKGVYSTSINRIFSGIATDEIYLIRAESAARSGNTTLALSDINTLLKKRWLNTVAFEPYKEGTVEDVLQLVLSERTKELLMRGLRWADIKRLNKEKEGNIVLKRRINGKEVLLLPNDNRYALPLPADIIKLTGMEQN